MLHDVSFTLEKTRCWPWWGPRRRQKVHAANLLSRFWDVKDRTDPGAGQDIRDIPLSDLMDQISMVFQRVYFFQDTVYNNIAMGRTDATREEVYEAARKARCYDFVMELPDGFDTVIGEGGASLSGGERRRISIARCILKDAPIVILDEATASVDADNESYIQEAITQLCRGKTLLVIAHRLNTIRHADEILVIDQGRIVQAGDHDKLMAEGGHLPPLHHRPLQSHRLVPVNTMRRTKRKEWPGDVSGHSSFSLLLVPKKKNMAASCNFMRQRV